jgi:hypothetical protein
VQSQDMDGTANMGMPVGKAIAAVLIVPRRSARVQALFGQYDAEEREPRTLWPLLFRR